jgi:hypothetical protein
MDSKPPVWNIEDRLDSFASAVWFSKGEVQFAVCSSVPSVSGACTSTAPGSRSHRTVVPSTTRRTGKKLAIR